MIVSPAGIICSSVWSVVCSLFLLALVNENSMGDGHCYRVPLIRFHPRVDFILISELKDLVKFCLGRTVPDASVLMFLKNAELFPSSHSFCAVRGETIYHITPRPGPVVPLYKYSSSKEAQNQGFSLTRNINAKVRFRNIILVLHMRDFRMERWRLLAFLHWCRYVKFQN